MVVHEFHTFGQGVIFQNSIGIEYQDIFTFSFPDRLVVGPGKAFVILVFNQADLRELLPDHPDRSIDRVIVNDKDLGCHTVNRFLYRVDALLYEILDVVVDDNDG